MASCSATTFHINVPETKVIVTPETHVYDTTFWMRNVAVVVVDVDREGVALVHNLRVLFPNVKIIAVTENNRKAVTARTYGASAVVLDGANSSAIVSSVVVSVLAGT